MTADNFIKAIEGTYTPYQPAMRGAVKRWIRQERPSEVELETLYDAVIRTYSSQFRMAPDPSVFDPLLSEMRRAGGDAALRRTQKYLEEIRQEKLRLIDDGSGESERDQVEKKMEQLRKKLTGDDPGPPGFRVIKKAPPPTCSKCGADISDQRKREIDRCECGEIIPEVVEHKRKAEAEAAQENQEKEQEKEKTG